jgi:hypothetical protein
VHDSRWLARAASDVAARSAEEAAPTPSSFAATMAGALRSLLGVDPARPVAAGTELLAASHALAQVFPNARFIHVIREVDGVVSALTAAPTADGAFYAGDRAWLAWLGATEQGLLVEQALGADAVLRVHYRDLVEQPQRAIERCLEFLGERPTAACTRPVTELTADLPVAAPPPSALVQRCRELNDAIDRPRTPAADPQAREQLASQFHRAQRRGLDGGSLVERTREFILAAAPEGATVAVISRGDPRMVELDGRRAWHLPQVESGTYAGHHPADGAQALQQLSRLQQRGADHLAIPASTLWWLTYYDEFRKHLESFATLVAFHEEVGAIYRLEVPTPPPDDGKPSAPRFAAVPARQEVGQ